MRHHQQVFRRSLIQNRPVRVAAFPQPVVVIARGPHPLTCRNLLPLNKLPDQTDHILKTLRFPQIHLHSGVCAGRKMAVGINKTGHQGMSLQIHQAHFPLSGRGSHVLKGSNRPDHPLLRQHRLGAKRLLHGNHSSIVKQHPTHPLIRPFHLYSLSDH